MPSDGEVSQQQEAAEAGSRIRVLLVGQGAPTAGGIPTFVESLTKDQWLNRKASIEFLNTTPEFKKQPGALDLRNLTQAGRDALAVFGRGRKCDVVHLNLAPAPSLPLIRALVLCSIAKAARTRVILHAHTGRLPACAEKRTYRVLLRLVDLVADAFVVVSEPAELAARPLVRKTHRLDNGVDVEGIPAGPKSTDPPVLSFVGTVCERKGLIDLRDALGLVNRRVSRLSSRVRVVIVGDSTQEGPDEFERIKGAFADSGLSMPAFTGRLARSRVLEVLTETSIFVLPSHWEGFPLSLLEGMAAGAAVVATNVGEIPRMLDFGAAGILVEPHDPAALGRAVEELLLDPTYRERLGAAARRRVEEQFSQGALVRKIWGLYTGAPQSM
ncbi:MAG TPA: glycosyltransferase family 4 protein [Actinomycetota bacterium]|nr:glycosyltransferase family 4 protein [Actinomycetota bacterium]